MEKLINQLPHKINGYLLVIHPLTRYAHAGEWIVEYRYGWEYGLELHHEIDADLKTALTRMVAWVKTYDNKRTD